MPVIIVLAIIAFFAFKLGIFNDVDYATTPYERMTCEDVADAVVGTGIENALGSKYVIKHVSNIERISKDKEKIVCKAIVQTDANEDFNLYLTGEAKSSNIRIGSSLD